MKSCRSSQWLCWLPIFIFLIHLSITNSEHLSEYVPKCIQGVCQNYNSKLIKTQCQKDECLSVKENLEKRTKFCEKGCQNFQNAFQYHSMNGCSNYCNLTELEASATWNDNLERLPTLACIYGCERAGKNFITHILRELKTIRPPQILRRSATDQKDSNESTVTVTFSKQTEKDISGTIPRVQLLI